MEREFELLLLRVHCLRETNWTYSSVVTSGDTSRARSTSRSPIPKEGEEQHFTRCSSSPALHLVLSGASASVGSSNDRDRIALRPVTALSLSLWLSLTRALVCSQSPLSSGSARKCAKAISTRGASARVQPCCVLVFTSFHCYTLSVHCELTAALLCSVLSPSTASASAIPHSSALSRSLSLARLRTHSEIIYSDTEHTRTLTR